jgi:pyruvate/2-oxoglutarate dehydrogenase complex dihydrolipoamide dehydrogenase (E3) component
MAQSVSPQEHPITVGIIGSGPIGTAFARTLARAGSKAGRERKV